MVDRNNFEAEVWNFDAEHFRYRLEPHRHQLPLIGRGVVRQMHDNDALHRLIFGQVSDIRVDSFWVSPLWSD